MNRIIAIIVFLFLFNTLVGEESPKFSQKKGFRKGKLYLNFSTGGIFNLSGGLIESQRQVDENGASDILNFQLKRQNPMEIASFPYTSDYKYAASNLFKLDLEYANFSNFGFGIGINHFEIEAQKNSKEILIVSSYDTNTNDIKLQPLPFSRPGHLIYKGTNAYFLLNFHIRQNNFDFYLGPKWGIGKYNISTYVSPNINYLANTYLPINSIQKDDSSADSFLLGFSFGTNYYLSEKLSVKLELSAFSQKSLVPRNYETSLNYSTGEIGINYNIWYSTDAIEANDESSETEVGDILNRFRKIFKSKKSNTWSPSRCWDWSKKSNKIEEPNTDTGWIKSSIYISFTQGTNLGYKSSIINQADYENSITQTQILAGHTTYTFLGNKMPFNYYPESTYSVSPINKFELEYAATEKGGIGFAYREFQITGNQYRKSLIILPDFSYLTSPRENVETTYPTDYNVLSSKNYLITSNYHFIQKFFIDPYIGVKFGYVSYSTNVGKIPRMDFDYFYYYRYEHSIFSPIGERNQKTGSGIMGVINAGVNFYVMERLSLKLELSYSQQHLSQELGWKYKYQIISSEVDFGINSNIWK